MSNLEEKPKFINQNSLIKDKEYNMPIYRLTINHILFMKTKFKIKKENSKERKRKIYWNLNLEPKTKC